MATTTKRLGSRLKANHTFSSKMCGSICIGFHDCVGGCDGCVNQDNPDNAGLGPIISELEIIYIEQVKQHLKKNDVGSRWSQTCIIFCSVDSKVW
jgi:hypothetical protein